MSTMATREEPRTMRGLYEGREEIDGSIVNHSSSAEEAGTVTFDPFVILL